MEPSSIFSITCLVKLSSVFGQACSMSISCNLKTFLVHSLESHRTIWNENQEGPCHCLGCNHVHSYKLKSSHICTIGTITLLVC